MNPSLSQLMLLLFLLIVIILLLNINKKKKAGPQVRDPTRKKEMKKKPKNIQKKFFFLHRYLYDSWFLVVAWILVMKVVEAKNILIYFIFDWILTLCLQKNHVFYVCLASMVNIHTKTHIYIYTFECILYL